MQFAEGDDAAAAIDNMHMSELNGRVIKVNLSSQTKARPGSSRAGTEPGVAPPTPGGDASAELTC